MTRQEAGRLRALALNLPQRRANQLKGAYVRRLLNGLGKSDGKASPSPWMLPCRVRLERNSNGA
jgi:hypothetical protein